MTSVRRRSAADATTADVHARLLTLLGPGIRALLRRCAVPPTFDRATFEEILWIEGLPKLDLMTATGQLEAAPGEGDRYRLAPSMRDTCLGDWWEEPGGPAEMGGLAGRLADVARRQGRDLEELSLRLVQDPVVAADLFRSLYAAADRRHDLGRCRAVLDVLDTAGHGSPLDAELVALRADHATYLAARTMWATEFYRSARYTQREAVEAVLEALLAGESAPILQLYADGGMGKSTQLRWFIARRCVPDRIPCARLDFDEAVHPVSASRHPWLLLVEAAAQLDQQITGLPFQELLAAYGDYRTLLTRKPVAEKLGSAPRHASRGEGDDALERFVAAVGSVSPRRPVVLVLDTFERVLHRSVDPTGIVELLEAVVERLPALRVVLAGRFDLRERVPVGLLPAVASHELTLLTDRQQHDYLVGVRGLAEDVAAQIQKLAEGRPLTLATYADLVLRSKDVTAAELATWRRPGLLMAIQRYVDEIGDHRVRWLLRYGVIPRRLRYDFVVSVMRPFLTDGMAGSGTWDDPAQDDRPPDDGGATFRTDLRPPSDERELREIWDALRDYASDYGWIWVAQDEPDALQIRGDVIRPLRELIRPHAVYLQLQRAAADYFERRASEDPERWLTWIREAIFHRFQHDARAAVGLWRAAIDRARAMDQYDRCLEFATELLGEDYVDRSGEPILPMTARVLASAHLERAQAAAALADQNQAGPEDPLWSEVEAGWGAVRALRESWPEIELPPTLTVALEARLALARGDARKARALLRDRHDNLTPSRELADLERALGQTLLASQTPDAVAHLVRSYEVARDANDMPGARQSVSTLVRTYTAASDDGAALALLDKARRDKVVDDSDPELGLFEAGILAGSGAVVRAREMVGRLIETGGVPETEARAILSYVCLQADDVTGAIGAAERCLRLAEKHPSRAVDTTSLALVLRGMAFAALLDPYRSATDLTAATSRARERRDHNSAAEYAGLAALVLTDLAGQLTEAAQILEEAQRSGPATGSRAWLRARLAAAHLRRALGEPSVETMLWETLAAVESGPTPPSGVAEVVVELLATAPPGRHAELVERLVRCLARITPPPNRLNPMWHLRDVPRLELPAALSHRLLVLLVVETDQTWVGGAPTGARPTAAWWWVAEVLRVAGRTDEARRLLDTALEGREHDLLGWWRWLDGMTRLGPPTADEPVPPDTVLTAPGTLAIACQLTLAERRMALDPLDRTVERLKAAEALLAGSRPYRWTARLAMAWAEVAHRRGEAALSRRHAGRAAAVYGRLGDVRQRDAVAGRFNLGHEDRHEDGGTIELRFGSLAGQHIDVAARRPDGHRISQSVSTLKFGDADDAAQTLSRLRTVMAPLVGGWRAWSKEVAEHLVPPDLRAALTVATGDYRDVRLVIESRDPAALPWELTRAWDADVPVVQAPAVGNVYRGLKRAARDEAKTRKLQELLRQLGYFTGVPDGLRGTLTAEAVRGLQEDSGITVDGEAGPETWSALRQRVVGRTRRRPRAILLRPGHDREAERQRGYAAGGQEPASAYLRHGFELVVMEDPGPDALTHAVDLSADGLPDLLHVMSPVRLVGGATVLDFGAEAGGRLRAQPGTSVLTVHALGDLCSVLARGAKIPLVVLDIPLPHSPLEAVRHLGVRNSFAFQLLRLGAAEAVLAMGLARPTDQAWILDRVVGGLAEGQDIAAVARTVQRSSQPDDLNATLAYAGSALYLDRPPPALLPLGY